MSYKINLKVCGQHLKKNTIDQNKIRVHIVHETGFPLRMFHRHIDTSVLGHKKMCFVLRVVICDL